MGGQVQEEVTRVAREGAATLAADPTPKRPPPIRQDQRGALSCKAEPVPEDGADLGNV